MKAAVYFSGILTIALLVRCLEDDRWWRIALSCGLTCLWAWLTLRLLK